MTLVAWICSALLVLVIAFRSIYWLAFRHGIEAPPKPIDPGAPLILDGQTSFWDMIQQHQTVFPTPPQMKPYDYWRDKFIASGSEEDLRQMERFVD